ncbi:hypothetical protein [Streptomyces sp. 6N223]|uniref:hypothetical protein n=1 Tax=Streptomyces sp. 6N223 TaxID=3457412 RepID=UPI003FD12ED1
MTRAQQMWLGVGLFVIWLMTPTLGVVVDVVMTLVLAAAYVGITEPMVRKKKEAKKEEAKKEELARYEQYERYRDEYDKKHRSE